MSQESLIRYFVKAFNEENMSVIEEVFHFPHVKIVNGKLTRFEIKDVPVIDFAGLKKTPWKYTKINQIKVLEEGSSSSMVWLDYSCYDKVDKEYLRSTTYFVLTKDKGYWQILSLNVIDFVAGAVSNK